MYFDLRTIYPFYFGLVNAQSDFDKGEFFEALLARIQFHAINGVDFETYIRNERDGKSVFEIKDSVPNPPNYITVFFMDVNHEGKVACWSLMVDKEGLPEHEARQRVLDYFKPIPIDQIFDKEDIIYE